MTDRRRCLLFSWSILKLRSDNRLWSVEGQEQLKIKFTTMVSCALWCKVSVSVRSVCVCARLAVNQREPLAPFFFLHSSNVAGWHTDNALSLCLLLACRAARSGLAVPDTEEAQGRRPAPWGPTDGLWAVCACRENVILVILVGL